MPATQESVGLGAGTETRIAAVVGISKQRPGPAFPSATLARGDSWRVAARLRRNRRIRSPSCSASPAQSDYTAGVPNQGATA